MPSHEWTISGLLRWATGYFEEKGIDSPRTTAEVLLAHGLKLERIDLYLRHDQPLNADELAAFKVLVKRRLSREPVAYITGRKEFWSLDLAVSPSVLIPRPETECLVEAVLDSASRMGAGGPLRILDLGTGSGAIALALASQRPSDWIVASDRSPAALEVARENASAHGLDHRIRFVAADWLTGFSTRRSRFDIIVSNPPYIDTRVLDGLEPEIRRHEPRLALDGDAGGLRHLRRILDEAPGHLVPGGRLFLEMGFDQRQPLAAAIEGVGRYRDVEFIKDYSDTYRVVRLCSVDGDTGART